MTKVKVVVIFGIFGAIGSRSRANLRIVKNLSEYCMPIFVFRTINVGIRYLSEFRIYVLFFRGNALKSKKNIYV